MWNTCGMFRNPILKFKYMIFHHVTSKSCDGICFFVHFFLHFFCCFVISTTRVPLFSFPIRENTLTQHNIPAYELGTLFLDFIWEDFLEAGLSLEIYHKDGEELKHRSIAIISDNLAHDTVAVLAYNVLQNITYAFLKLYSSGQRVITKKPKFSSAAKKVMP